MNKLSPSSFTSTMSLLSNAFIIGALSIMPISAQALSMDTCHGYINKHIEPFSQFDSVSCDEDTMAKGWVMVANFVKDSYKLKSGVTDKQANFIIPLQYNFLGSRLANQPMLD